MNKAETLKRQRAQLGPERCADMNVPGYKRTMGTLTTGGEMKPQAEIWAVVDDDGSVKSTADTKEMAEERRERLAISETQLGPHEIVKYVPAPEDEE